MSLAISGTLSAVDAQADAREGRPLIAYENHFRTGTVTVSSAQDDHPSDAATDLFTATAWIGAEGDGDWWIHVAKDGATADYAAVTGWRGDYDESDPYSLTGVTVRLQYSDDGGDTWEDVDGPIMPDGRVAGFLFDSQTHDDWRFFFSADDPPEIVNISLGEATVMDRGVTAGFEPTVQARNNEIMNNQSDQGHLVGKSIIRRGVETSLDIQTVDETWVRNIWEPLVDHMEVGAAYIIWNPRQWPNEIAYCWAERIRKPRYTNNVGYMGVQIDVKGIT